MVLVQSTLSLHHSDSPTLTFWRLKFSTNEGDAEPIDLPRLNVELFLIRVDGPSNLSNCIGLDCHVTTQVKVAQN